ncbi:MAG: hypothetical protein ABSE36_02970 [Terracidiphilus sp.]|jgi:uncharacterized membrane protein YphA (DoxX/SURF4 family)
MNRLQSLPKFGLAAYGAAAIILGVFGFVWQDFAVNWQRVPYGFQGRAGLACAVAACELLAGVAILSRRFARAGAMLLTFVYAIFTTLWVIQALKAPAIYDSWGNVFEEFSLFAAGLAACATLAPPGSRWAGKAHRVARIYGISAISFGVDHIVYWRAASTWVPAWLPPGQVFWIFFTAICFLLAATAILSGIRARLAAALLTAEILGFEIFVWIPRFIAGPHDHFNWSGNAINLAMMSAAWVVADAFSTSPPQTKTASAPANAIQIPH